MVAELPQGVQRTPGNIWYQVYTAVTNAGQPINILGNRLLGDFLTGVLQWMVSSVTTNMFLFAFLTLAAYPVRRIGFGFTLYRVGLAGILTTIFLQPLVLFVLAIGSVALKLSGSDVGSMDSSLSVVLLVACIMPLLLFFFAYRRLQKIQIEGPIVTKNGDPGGMMRGLTFGKPDSRPYAGRIPEAGDTMEGVASKANWVGNKLAVASKALAVAAPEAVPFVASAVAVTSTIGSVAEDRAEKSKDKAEAQAEPHSIDGSPGHTEFETQSSATVVRSEDQTQILPSSPPEAVDETPKLSKAQVVRQGASKAAEGTSSAAYAVEKAARWASGAQRKAKVEIDRQLRR